MARAPQALFRQEDFGDLTDADTIQRFLRLLNSFTNDTRSALAKGLTLGDNAAAFWKTLDVQVDGSGGASCQFKNELGAKPRGVLIAEAHHAVTKAALALGPIAWGTKDDQVVVSSIGGAPASQKVTVTFLVLGG